MWARNLLYIFIITACIACRKDTELNQFQICSGNITPASESFFRKIAQDFAFFEIAANPEHKGYNEFLIDEVTVQYYLGKLAAIYQKATDTADVLHDLVFKYGVNQGASQVHLQSLIVDFRENSAVLAEIKAGKDTYSEPFINKMKNDYWLYPKQFIAWPSKVIFTSEVPFNVDYVKRYAAQVPQVTSAEFDSYFNNGRRVEHSKEGEADVFLFRYGWGDCMAGCMYAHYWKIKVNPECSVELIEQYGDELPE